MITPRNLYVASVTPLSPRIEGIFTESGGKRGREGGRIYGGPLDTTSKATLDTPAANIQRYVSVFPGKTNLVERTCLIESGEGRGWGGSLAKRGFIEATYTTVFMIRASSLWITFDYRSISTIGYTYAHRAGRVRRR